MESEELRTGSGESENSSDNSYVQVTQEDAPSQDQFVPEMMPKIPSGEEDEDIYNFGTSEKDSTITATKEPQDQVRRALSRGLA